jgi:hypothetical protein
MGVANPQSALTHCKIMRGRLTTTVVPVAAQQRWLAARPYLLTQRTFFHLSLCTNSRATLTNLGQILCKQFWQLSPSRHLNSIIPYFVQKTSTSSHHGKEDCKHLFVLLLFNWPFCRQVLCYNNNNSNNDLMSQTFMSADATLLHQHYHDINLCL